MRNLALRVVATTGIVCTLGGTTATIYNWNEETLGVPSALGLVLIVVGVVLLCYCGIRAKGRSIEEAYRLGYDIGFERGYRHTAEPLAIVEEVSDTSWTAPAWWAQTDG